ncbi:MAG: glycosyltransferase, partial [Cyanobacteria bacterium J06641_5]
MNNPRHLDGRPLQGAVPQDEATLISLERADSSLPSPNPPLWSRWQRDRLTVGLLVVALIATAIALFFTVDGVAFGIFRAERDWLAAVPLPEWVRVVLPLLPTVAFTSGVLAFKRVFPVANQAARGLTAGVLILLGTRYLLWRALCTLNFSTPGSAIVGSLLLAAEGFTWLNTLGFYALAIPSRDRAAEADAHEATVKAGKYLPWVDVLVPSYNEPAEVLRRTIIGCQAMAYPHKRIYLLDDSRRAHMRRLAEELGCNYLDRPDNRHAKAGNINHALPYINGEIAVFFDADFVPSRNFLTRTIGFFQDAKVALVQTPQHFFNEDPIAIDLGLQGTLTDEQALFYRHIQPSRDVANAIVCCGSCYAIRRSALDEIGGIPTESITEDLLTSIKLQRRGWRTLYLNEALSAGLAPEDIGAYANQRLRWCQGTIQTLFCEANPLTSGGLNLWQRCHHGLGVLYWFLSFSRIVFLLMPLAFLLFGWVPLDTNIESLALFYLPFYACNVLAFSWLNGGRRSAFWSDVYEALLCVPMAIALVRTLRQPFGKRFKVTPKGIATERVRLNLELAWPLYASIALSVVGVVKAIAQAHVGELDLDSLWICWVWVSYNLAVAMIAALAAIDVPKPDLVEFPHVLACELRSAAQCVAGETLELSETSATIALTGERTARDLPGNLLLGLSELVRPLAAVMPLEAKVEWQTSRLLGVRFVNLTLQQQRAIAEFLYCQPGQWEDRRTPELRSTWALLQTVYGFYPLQLLLLPQPQL